MYTIKIRMRATGMARTATYKTVKIKTIKHMTKWCRTQPESKFESRVRQKARGQATFPACSVKTTSIRGPCPTHTRIFGI